MTVFEAYAEVETYPRRERQMYGISKANAEGRYKTRPKALDKVAIRRLHAERVIPMHVAQ